MDNPRPLTFPATYAVHLGGDFTEWLGMCAGGGDWEVYNERYGWDFYGDVRVVRELIPEGTPVDRVVVLPEVGEVTVDDGDYYVGGDWVAQVHEGVVGLNEWVDRMRVGLANAVKTAAFIAARDAKPTPDLLTGDV